MKKNWLFLAVLTMIGVLYAIPAPVEIVASFFSKDPNKVNMEPVRVTVEDNHINAYAKPFSFVYLRKDFTPGVSAKITIKVPSNTPLRVNHSSVTIGNEDYSNIAPIPAEVYISTSDASTTTIKGIGDILFQTKKPYPDTHHLSFYFTINSKPPKYESIYLNVLSVDKKIISSSSK